MEKNDDSEDYLVTIQRNIVRLLLERWCITRKQKEKKQSEYTRECQTE